jgi:hypothetical protein
MMLGPVLAMVNGPILADAIRAPDNRLAKLCATEKDDRKIVEELFLAAFARLPNEHELAAGLKALAGHRDEFNQAVAEGNKRAAELAAYEKGIPARMAEWEKAQQKTAWTVLDPATMKSEAGAVLKKQADHSILVSGKNTAPEVYTVTANTPLTGITGVRLEVLSDPKLPAKGPGRAPNGNFVLSEFRVTASPEGDSVKAKPVALHNAKADFSQDQYPVANAIDGKKETGWAVAPQLGQQHVAVFETREPLSIVNGTALTFTLEQHFAGKDHNIGKFRLSVTTSKAPLSLEGPPEPVARILAVEPDKRTQQQKDELLRFYRAQDAELARLQAAAAEAPPPNDPRLIGAQDLMWALLNSKAFLFNY